MRPRWSRPGYWSWWWRSSFTRESKLATALIALGAVGVGGYLAADTLGGSTDTTDVYETTVKEVVTVRERGRIVRRPVQVVRRVRVTTSTAADGTQVITRRIVSTVPVIRRQVVTRDGVERTVVERETVPVRQTVTDQRTVVDPRTVTDERVVTTERVVTAVRTVTNVDTRTVTVPTTVTETRTETQTETETVTTGTTITVTLP
jgi:hypothetical protein